jgi:hypothetical protein
MRNISFVRAVWVVCGVLQINFLVETQLQPILENGIATGYKALCL